MRNIIDMHTHFSIETGAVSEDAGRIGFTVENKSLGEHLNMMDRLGITHAVLSCPTLKYLDDPAVCVKYCRQVNALSECAATIAACIWEMNVSSRCSPC